MQVVRMSGGGWRANARARVPFWILEVFRGEVRCFKSWLRNALRAPPCLKQNRCHHLCMLSPLCRFFAGVVPLNAGPARVASAALMQKVRA